MRTSSPLLLLGTLGALSATAGNSMAAPDTSQWKCESCPFETGTSGAVDVGVGHVSQQSAKFGDYTGLDRNGGFVIAGGAVRYLGKDGLFGNLAASDLGLDTRSLAAQLGREGVFTARLGYAELPHRLSDSAMTPFLGNGGGVLSLPGGFPAATTGAMPLNTTLQPVDLGSKRKRLDVGASLLAMQDWTYRVNVRHEVRDGTQRFAGSFFSNTSQLAAPVDQVTDQLEASASYASGPWQATLAYNASVFRNGQDSLIWTNPFTNGVIASGSGQLALAPDNEFHQIVATAGYEISPKVRASAEVAVGRMTQDAPYLAATRNSALAVPALPESSLHGQADTLDVSVRLSAAPTERLRVNASVTRNERDNQTPSAAYPAVSTDMFLGVVPRTNQPFSFTQDRFKLGADYRGPGSLKLAAGAEYDVMNRTQQETDSTRESTLWARLGAQLRENVSLGLKLAHAERRSNGYNTAAWIDPPENPLLRKYNQADRTRNLVSVRSDIDVNESVSVGFNADWKDDDYLHSSIGLVSGRSVAFGGDLSAALSEATRLRLYAQGERIRSSQAGSQLYGQPDWTGRNEDAVDVVGFGISHTTLGGKLELGADLTYTRSHSDVTVDTGAFAPPFPTAGTALDSVKLSATYRLKENISLTGSYWYERYDAQDWRLDGVLPATVPNLLAFGEQPPRYTVNVFRLALRYRF